MQHSARGAPYAPYTPGALPNLGTRIIAHGGASPGERTSIAATICVGCGYGPAGLVKHVEPVACHSFPFSTRQEQRRRKTREGAISSAAKRLGNYSGAARVTGASAPGAPRCAGHARSFGRGAISAGWPRQTPHTARRSKADRGMMNVGAMGLCTNAVSAARTPFPLVFAPRGCRFSRRLRNSRARPRHTLPPPP